MESTMESQTPAQDKTTSDYYFFDTTERTFWEYDLSLIVQAVGSSIIVPLGLVGNTLSIAVMSQSRMRNSTSIYLIVLACSDLMVICVGQLCRVFPRGLANVDTGHLSVWWCRSWFVINHTASTISGWTLVAVTIERVLVVYFPLKAKSICTKIRAKKTVSVIIIISTCCYLHYFWTYGEKYRMNEKNETVISSCTIVKRNAGLEYYIVNVRPWQDLIVRSVAVFGCLLTCNCLIVGKLLAGRRKMKTIVPEKGQLDKKMVSMTGMLLSVSFAHLICIAPLQIMYLIDKSDPFGWEIQHRWQAVVALRWAFAIDVYYANNAINFLLYCISGSEFRRNLRLLFARIPACRRCVKEGEDYSTHSYPGHNNRSQKHNRQIYTVTTEEPEIPHTSTRC